MSQCGQCMAIGSHFKDCPAHPRKKTVKELREDRGDTSNIRTIARQQAGGVCQAHGLHHPDCPQADWNDTPARFVAHHIWKSRQGGSDDATNLMWVWNGETRLGTGGCHGMIEAKHPTVARALGFLRMSEGDPVFGIGIAAALEGGWLTDAQIQAVAA